MHDFLTRNTLFYLLFSMAISMALHVPHLPVWIPMVSAGALLWRYLVHLGYIKAPNFLLKGVFVFASCTGIYFSYFSLGKVQFSIEAMIALFAIGAALKPLEVSAKRDAYILVFLCYFFTAMAFIFDQTPLMALLVFSGVVFNLTAQINLSAQVKTKSETSFSGKKLALQIVAQSIPLALILFIVVPRVGPLWSLNVKTHSAKTGLSDAMTPGDIANLSNSDELAFIVNFKGEIPVNEKLYWRAWVLNDFDGKTWSTPYSRFSSPKANWGPDNSAPTDSIEYQVLIEPHDKNWLFALDRAYPASNDEGLRSDFRMVSRHSVRSTAAYWVKSDMSDILAQSNMSALEYGRLIALPRVQKVSGLMQMGQQERESVLSGSRLANPQSHTLAMLLKSNSKSDLDYIEKVKGYFLSQPFAYTLKPGQINSDNTIDEFLFEKKKGFCAHYAGAFTYLMRLADIPTRIVIGYQGGEYNADGDYMAVYQYNAHAWVEVWLEELGGWKRFDPTSWIAPDRIEQGIEDALAQEFSQRSYFSTRNWPLLNEIRKQFQLVDMYWNQWVLSYDRKQQQALLNSLFGDSDWGTQVLIILAVFAGIVGSLFAGLWWRAYFKQEAIPFEQQQYLKMIRWLQDFGLAVDRTMSPKQVEAAILQFLGQDDAYVSQVFVRLNNSFYGALTNYSESQKKQNNRQLKKQIARVKRQVVRKNSNRTRLV